MGNARKRQGWTIGRLPLGLLFSSTLALAMTAQVGVAQGGNFPVCTSPESDEYLVLIATPSQPLREEVRLQVGRTLPRQNDLIVCEYGGNILSRVGGFNSQNQALDWANYFDDAVGLPSMVITPVDDGAQTVASSQPPVIPTLDEARNVPEDVVVPTETSVQPENFEEQIKPAREIPVATLASNTPANAASSVPVEAFKPQRLTGAGYAVLVDYGANPAIASQLKALLDRDIALVTYSGRGYLLADQVADGDQVTTLLNQLNQNNFLAIAVPTEQTILLKASVTP